MKLKKNDSICVLAPNISLSYNGLHLEYCHKPEHLEQYFTNDDNIKSFPPDGLLQQTELDYFYLIKNEEQIIGFYRLIDMFFDGEIEMHGSLSSYHSKWIMSYIKLSKLFVDLIVNTFSSKSIVSVVHKNNTIIFKLLNLLDFKMEGLLENNPSYIRFVKS